MAPSSTTDAASFYEDENNLKLLCDFLRSSEGPAVREAIEMDKRVYYLKGKLSLPRVGSSLPSPPFFLNYIKSSHHSPSLILLLLLLLLQEKSLSTSWLNQRRGLSGPRTFQSSKLARRLLLFARSFVITSTCTDQRKGGKEILL
jgi:hypothetical protein